MYLSKCTKADMPCEIQSKEGEVKREVSLTSDFRLPDILAFGPVGILNTKKTRNRIGR